MNSEQKAEVVGELQSKFSQAGAAFLVNYQGCTCEDLKSLRRKLRPAGAEFAVVKNTLAKRALDGTEAADLAEMFTGPTGVIWAGDDPVTPAKVITDFAKTNERFAIKAGVVEGRTIAINEIESLASLPSREELLGKLLSLINAPATRLLQTMNAPASSLVRTLEAWRAELEKR